MPSTTSSSSAATAAILPFEPDRPAERMSMRMGFAQAREAWLRHWKGHSQLTHAERGLLEQIADHFNRQHYDRTGEFEAWPSWERIAAKGKLSEATIRRGFKKFEQLGVLEITHGGRDPKTGWKLQNSYHVTWSPPIILTGGHPSSCKKSTRQDDGRLSEDRLSEEEKNLKIKIGNSRGPKAPEKDPSQPLPSNSNLKPSSAEPCEVPRGAADGGGGGGGGGGRRYVAFDDPGWELVERWERGLPPTKRRPRAKGGGYWLTDDEWRQVLEVAP